MEIKQIEPSPLAEWRVAISLSGVEIFYLGFNRLAFLSDLVYIVMEPTGALRDLKVSEFKELRKMFNGIRGWRLICQVIVGDHKGAHWARFFDFKYKETVQNRWHFEKDTR